MACLSLTQFQYTTVPLSQRTFNSSLFCGRLTEWLTPGREVGRLRGVDCSATSFLPASSSAASVPPRCSLASADIRLWPSPAACGLIPGEGASVALGECKEGDGWKSLGDSLPWLLDEESRPPMSPLTRWKLSPWSRRHVDSRIGQSISMVGVPYCLKRTYGCGLIACPSLAGHTVQEYSEKK